MTQFKCLWVWAALSALIFEARLKLMFSGYTSRQTFPIMRWIPSLNEPQRSIALRRLLKWRPNCLAWSQVARAYLRHCGESCEIGFQADIPDGLLQAHEIQFHNF